MSAAEIIRGLPKHKINRRHFLRHAGAGVALFNILPGGLLNGAENLSPNAKLNVAGIGIGSRGGGDVGEVAGLGHNIVALCDVDEKYAWDWIEAIRTGRQAGSNFDYGGPLTQVALLGLIAIRFPGQTLRWDDKAMRFTNNQAANAHLRSAYRSGWSL